MSHSLYQGGGSWSGNAHITDGGCFILLPMWDAHPQVGRLCDCKGLLPDCEFPEELSKGSCREKRSAETDTASRIT